MENREMSIPKSTDEKKENTLTKEEAEYIRKVFFEEDEEVRLRDGKTYRIPPLCLEDALILMEKMNAIDTAIIISNLISIDGENRYDELLDVIHMGFKPYYPEITKEYLAKYIDLVTAKKIIDAMIGLNGLKKSL